MTPALTTTIARLASAKARRTSVPSAETLVAEAARRLGLDWRDCDDADRLRLLHEVRLLGRAWLRREAERAQAVIEAEGDDATKALFGRARAAAERFFDRAGKFIRSSILAGWLAVAGPGEPTAAVADALDRGTTEQHEYLANFKSEVLEERKRLLPGRAEQYGGAVWTTAQNARLAEQVARETPYGRRVHRGADEPCPPCAKAVGLGWVPLKQLPPLGDCDGGPACHCSYEFARTLPGKAWGHDGAALTIHPKARTWQRLLAKADPLAAIDPNLDDDAFLDDILKRFNPSQARDANGRWVAGAGGGPAARQASRRAAGQHAQARRTRNPRGAHNRLLDADRTRVGQRIRGQRREAETAQRADLATLHAHRDAARRNLAARHAAELAAVRGNRKRPVKRHDRERATLERRYDRTEAKLRKEHETQRQRERAAHRGEAARLREDHERAAADHARRRQDRKPKSKERAGKPAPTPAHAPEVRIAGTLSPEAHAAMKSVVSSLPPKVLGTLKAGGEKFVFARDMAHAAPEIANDTPRGWTEGMTWSHADGAHHGGRNEIIACEFRKHQGSDEWVKSGRIGGTLRHETGHGFDAALGYASRTDEFTRAYASDVAKMDGVVKVAFMSYYLQSHGAGQSEAFAELFAQHLGGGAHDYDIRPHFPETRKVIKRLLA